MVFFLFCFSPALTNSTYSRTSFKWARAVPELRACPLPSAWCPARGPRRESRGGSAPLPSLAAGCGADVPSMPQWDGFAPTRIFEDKVPSCVFPACLPFPPENPVCYHFAAVRKSFPQHVLGRRADGRNSRYFLLSKRVAACAVTGPFHWMWDSFSRRIHRQTLRLVLWRHWLCCSLATVFSSSGPFLDHLWLWHLLGQPD